jgi:hypothetical protein
MRHLHVLGLDRERLRAALLLQTAIRRRTAWLVFGTLHGGRRWSDICDAWN